MEKTLLLFVATIISATAYGEFYRSPPDSIDIASLKLLKNLYEVSSDKNVVLSPLGALTLLSLYGSGCDGKNREEILQLLGSTDYKEISDFYSELSERFSSMDPSYLSLANKIFVSDKYSLNDEFFNASKLYKSDVDNINFEDTQSAVDTINEWSSKKTNGIINHPMSQSDIDSDTAVALLNVIFFQGHWHVPFNASETKEQEFHVDRSTVVKKPMMHLVKPLFYYEDEDMAAKMITLPYKESNFRMIVVLPNEIDGLPQVLEKASEKGLLRSIYQMRPRGTDVKLDMPKFEIKTKTNFNDILPKVGVSSIFRNGALGIVKERKVRVSKALQEAFIRVDEEGATAGAFTGYVITPMSFPPRRPTPIYFKVDRPFLYAILHDDIIIFAGTYTH